MMNYLSQPSTWRGLTILGGVGAHVFGVPLADIINVAGAIIGLIEVATNENK